VDVCELFVGFVDLLEFANGTKIAETQNLALSYVLLYDYSTSSSCLWSKAILKVIIRKYLQVFMLESA
jgi:hypothetical protein